MVRYEIKSNPTGQYYIPKEVRQELGPRLFLICDAKTALVFSPETPIDIILDSIEIIVLDLKHRNKIACAPSREPSKEIEGT